MLMTDIISKKKNGQSLTKEEIHYFIDNYSNDLIPDYQASAFTMAICFQGMDKNEITNLTEAMLHSGEVIDLSLIDGVKVDKHSTGGVGDKTSLVLGPLVASCGVKVAKMSGRGLGHTGGTLDKLESIPGVSVDISKNDFIKQVNDIGIAIIGQTANLVPADKKLYALRDVTSTVDSIPLISSSIMSKKLASGSDTILLDVKFGSGAFMKSLDDARILAKTMVEIGKDFSKDTRAVLTDMDQPLGKAIGNTLEVIEAIETLKGQGPKDLEDLCISLGCIILNQAGIEKNEIKARDLLKQKIKNGEALEKLKLMVERQGGNRNIFDNYQLFKQAKYVRQVTSPSNGYIHAIKALEIGEGAMHLGAGRATKDDIIDMSSGLVLNKKIGDYVKKGELLFTAYTDKEDVGEILKLIVSSIEIKESEVNVKPLVYEIIR